MNILFCYQNFRAKENYGLDQNIHLKLLLKPLLFVTSYVFIITFYSQMFKKDNRNKH